MQSTTLGTLGFAFLSEQCCIVLYQGTAAPSDADWDAYIELVRSVAHLHVDLKILVYTEGGRPSQKQQLRLADASRDHHSHVAVVSSALPVRFVVSTLSLVKRNLRLFVPAELPQAFEHLSLDAAAQHAVQQTIEGLRVGARAAVS